MKKNTFKILSDYRSFLMGIAIISIIIFHVTEDCHNYHYMFNGVIKLYYNYISAVGVDIFLLLSGLGLLYSMKKNDNIKEFYKKRYLKILIPYLVVAIPALIQFCIAYNQDISYFFKELSFINVFLIGTRKYWYVVFICICYFIFPILFKYINKSKDTDEVVTKVLLLTTIITLFTFIFQSSNPVLFKRINLMLVRFFPFFLGMLFGYLSYNKKKIETTDYMMMVMGIPFILLVRTSSVILKTYGRFLSITACCFLLVLLLNKIDKYKVIAFLKRIVEWFGKYSFEIYLIHVSIRRVFASYKWYTCEPKYFVPYIVISILLVPIVNRISKLIEKLITRIFSHKKMAN